MGVDVRALAREIQRERLTSSEVPPVQQTATNATGVRSALRNLMRDGIDATGLGGGYRTGLLNLADGIDTASEFAPVIGDAIALEDAGRSFNRGDMLETGINMLGAVPIVGGVVKGAKKARSALRGIDAYHGSPHSFDKFSTTGIGTGEGAQAYGHGLYFAESKEVAQQYQAQLSDSGIRVKGKDYEDAYDVDKGKVIPRTHITELAEAALREGYTSKDISEARRFLTDRAVMRSGQMSDMPKFNQYKKDIDTVIENFDDYELRGNLYGVNLGVDPETMMDWDAPLSAQSTTVQSMWEKFSGTKAAKLAAKEYGIDDIRNLPSKYGGEITGEDIHGAIYNGQPSDFSHDYSSGVAPQESRMASDFLKKEGVSGIRYLDGNSRTAGKGTSNFVIFDGENVNIKTNNGKPQAQSTLRDLFGFNPLDPSTAARMSRAEEQGFDMDNTYYHGTNNTFEEFDASLGEGSRKDTGVFVSNTPDVASSYAGGTSAQVLPLRVRLQNPMKVYADGSNWSKLGPNTRVDLPRRVVDQSKDADLLGDLGFARPSNTKIDPMKTSTLKELFPDFFNKLDDNVMTTNEFSRWAKKQGVDGVIFEDISDRGSRGSFNNDKASMPSRNAIIFDPKNIRSTNAEFDPAKADSADLLSSISLTQSSLRNIA